jgi:hemerythrin superfamily protein
LAKWRSALLAISAPAVRRRLRSTRSSPARRSRDAAFKAACALAGFARRFGAPPQGMPLADAACLNHPRSPPMATRKTAATPRASAAAAKKDATLLLQRDHREVKQLFKDFEKLSKKESPADDRQALAERICMLLTVHAEIEEEAFYPAAREAGVDSHLLDEAEVEHASAKELIAQIRSMSPDEELYDAKVIVLGEYVDHHVQEEEGEMFPKCRKSDMDLEELAAELERRKAELMADEAEFAA